jgi:osmoprotectant transport system permease protein
MNDLVDAFPFIADNSSLLIDRALEQVLIAAIAMAIALAIAVPLGIWLGHLHRGSFLAINVSNLGRALPSIALIAILIAPLGLGRSTLIIALVVLAVPPILTNAYTGMVGVDPDVRDAARGMGLTDNQILRRIELPLAMPEILAGLRIAVTTTVGLATLAFFAGGGGLGEQIYSEKAGTGGIFFRSNVVVAGGLAVLLAAFGDLIVLAVQRALTPWRRAAHA